MTDDEIEALEAAKTWARSGFNLYKSEFETFRKAIVKVIIGDVNQFKPMFDERMKLRKAILEIDAKLPDREMIGRDLWDAMWAEAEKNNAVE